MEFLFKKMLRDIRSNWTQFFSVFLMATISVLIFSGMASVWTGLNSQVSAFADDSNMADIWVKAVGITDDDINKINAVNGVDEAVRCMSLSLSESNGNGEIQVNTVDGTDISKPCIISGIEYDKDSAEGIWLDAEYAKEHDLKVGNKISLDGLIGTCEFEIMGTVMTPEYIYYTGNITETVPNYKKYGYAFVGNTAMLNLTPQIVWSQVKLITSEDISDSEFENIFGERFICAQDRDTYTQFARSSQESSQMQKMATLFSAVFILLSLMTMYTSMVRLVNRQKTHIGTLKALGVSSSSIRLHYACYGLVIPIVGGLLGLVIGRFTVAKALMKVKQTTIYLPEWKLIHSKASFLLIGFIALCCVFASVWAAQRCLKGMPVEIMRSTDNSNEKNLKASENSSESRMSYEWKWTFRNIKQNKIRFIMGIVGVMGGMVLMIAGLGVKDAINGSNDFVFEKQFKYNTKVLLSTAGEVFDTDDAGQWLQESNIELKADNQETKQTVITVCDDGEMMLFYDDDDNEISLPQDGALISRKLADDLEIKSGDTVNIRLFGSQDWLSVTIKETSKTLSPQSIFMSKEAYESLNMTFTPTTLLSASDNSESFLESDKVKSVISKEQQIENTETVADSVMSVVKLLIMASVLLSVVILYNLGILNYVERIRDYATMKVLGFYHKEIRSLAIRECILTTAIGWIIGLPLGMLFLKLYVKIISFDTFEWIASVNASTLAIASVVIIGVSIVVNLILSSKVRKIIMVEALKSVE